MLYKLIKKLLNFIYIFNINIFIYKNIYIMS